jgi:membrane-associated protease RseP (regulator of RpoE activity)
MIFGVLGFIVIILISIMLHEFGHFLTAKAFGMKATEFFVGFGQRVWSFRRGETEYGIKAIPAGGYVRIIGMSESEQVAAADEPRAFYRKPAWQRLIVLSAGSAMHFVIAFVLLAAVFLTVDQTRATTTIGEVSPCVTDGTASGCRTTDPVSPAAAAGFQPGDRVVSVNGQPVHSWSDFVRTVHDSAGRPLDVVVERDGEQVTLHPTPISRKRPDLNNPAHTVDAGWLGIAAQPETYQPDPITALGDAGRAIGSYSKLTVQTLAAIPSKIPNLWDATFNGAERDNEGLVGVVGAGRISGEVIANEDQPLSARIGDFLVIMAGLNVIIGIFNMLPLLPMDGGHVALLLVERMRAAAYRLVGRPDPGRIDPAKLLPATYLVLVLLVMLTVLLVTADIVNPVRLPN